MDMNLCKIYYLTDYTNKPRYIGKTKNTLKNRRNEHISNSKTSKKILMLIGGILINVN